MATRKKLGRSLGIAIAAVIVNATLLGVVFFEISPPGANDPPKNPEGQPRVGLEGTATARANPASPQRDRSRPGRKGIARKERTASSAIDWDAVARDRKTRPPGKQPEDHKIAESEEMGRAPLPSLSADEAKQPRDQDKRPVDAAPARDRRADALTLYQTKKEEAAQSASAQKQLASWCDSKGLWDQAKSHWEAVVRLEPRNEAARKRLGYRLRGGQWNADAALAEEAVQKRGDSFWGRELALDHKHMHQKGAGPDAARGRMEAVARVEAVRDPLAVPSLWRAFAGDHSHHKLLVDILAQIKSPRSSQMLAALAVYSLDQKSRTAAIPPLQGRDPAEFDTKLVMLLSAPLRYQVSEVPVGSGRKARVLLIEGEKADYQLLYPPPATPDAFCGVVAGYLPGITSGAMAQQFNQEQARLAAILSNQQVESDKLAVEALNRSIRALNERVVHVLSNTCGTKLGPDPEAWRRWLAERHGTTYTPPDPNSKIKIAQVVQPLYNPTFLPVPAPS